MPAAGPQNTRRKQVKKRKIKASTPKGRPTNDAQYYVSEGGAVRRAAKTQKTLGPGKVARPKKKSQVLHQEDVYREGRKPKYKAQSYVSQGEAVEKRATELARQTSRVKRSEGHQTNPLKVLRRAAQRELEGKGLLAEGLGAIGKLAETGGKIQAGHASDVLLKRKTSSVLPDQVNPAVLLPRAAKDFVNLPAQALPSLYEPAAGAVEALKGDSSRLKQLGKEIDKSDFAYNLGAAGLEAAKGHPRKAAERLDRAHESAVAHPGYAFAEVAGVKGTLGRGTGRVLRSGVAGKTLKRVASTTREPLVLEGTGVKVNREYSPDVFTKGRQVLEEKHGTAAKRSTQVTVKELHHRVDERVAVTGLDPYHFVGEFAARTRTGKQVSLFTPAQAVEAAAELQKRTGHEFVAQNAGAHAKTGFAASDKARQVLVPKVALDRLLEHRDHGRGKSTVGKGLGVANDAFRQTVLSTSTSWAAGNVIEASLRSGLAKAGPRSLITGHRVMKRLEHIDPAKADELARRVTGGGHYGLAEKAKIQSVAEHFADTSVEPLANALHRVRETHGPKEVADLWRVWTHSVFTGMRKVESQFQKAQLGAEIRRSHLMDGHALKLGNRAIDQAAEGLRDTNEQVRFARAVEEMYGKYGSFSPSMKHAVTYYTPFAAWFLNSVHFITRVLPRDHPTAVGLTAAAVNATHEWRKDHGLDLWMKGSVPGWLQGSVPTKGGGKLRISRFTPFGAFGDLGGTLSGNVLPAYSGPLLALKGLAWNGQRLDYGDGPEGSKQAHNALVSIGEFIDATIPVVSQAKRIHEKGAAALNPFEPVKAKPKKKIRRSTANSAPKWNDGGGRFKFNGGSSGVKWDG